ncbi:MAG: hypothetical protein K2X82_32575 [Gemmataceae bacterium]|nr:hypothetical protein [Gemmataceae bacterium]
MTRLAAAVVWLLLLPVAARAGGPFSPIYDQVPRNFTLVLDHEQPGYEFYLVGEYAPPGRQVERLPLTRATPVRLTPDGRVPVGQTFEKTTPALLGHFLYAVPADRRAVMPADPPVGWFREPGNAVDMGVIDFVDFVPFHDSRDVVEVMYRVRDVRLGWESLEQVAENRGSFWVWLGWMVGLLLAATVAAFVMVWLARRFTREMLA